METTPAPTAPIQSAALSILVLLLLAGCTGQEPTAAGPATPPDDAPRLVLFVTVDQLRGDYLDRFGPLLTGGLARMLDEGVSFTDAHHFHAQTVTATGHATLATGQLPRTHGIVGNWWYRRDLHQEVHAVFDTEFGRSPRQLLTPTVGDLLKFVYPQSKVYGIGGKDRAALFTSGKKADGAFFYDRDAGDFRTSEFFMEELPGWLTGFNEERYVDRYFARPWEPLRSLEELAEYGVAATDWGWFDRGFPHPLGGFSLYPNEDFYDDIYASPFIDEYVIELAKRLIEGEGLGQDEWPDLLAVNLSATDSVGHEYGPNSPELADTVLRVDRVLAGLFNYVDRTIGLDNVLISLSSDHGAGAMPEYLVAQGQEAGRVGWEEIGCFQRTGHVLEERFGPEKWFEFALYLDRQLVGDKGLDAEDVKGAAAAILAECPGVATVHDGEALLARADLSPMEQLYANSFHPERSPDLLVQPMENVLFSSSIAASHGSPYRYDTWVPWVVRLPEGRRGVVTERVHTIDVAPTLGSYLGLRIDEQVDGADRSALIARASDVERGDLVETSAAAP